MKDDLGRRQVQGMLDVEITGKINLQKAIKYVRKLLKKNKLNTR